MATVQLCRFTRDAITNRRVGWQYLFVRSGAGSAIQMAMTRRLNCSASVLPPLGRGPIAHLTREWTRNFTGSTPSTRRRSPPQGARAIDGKLRRQGRRPRVPAPEQTKTPRPTLTPPPNKTRRPTAVPEQSPLRTSPDFVDPPAATAAAAASPQREAAAAPALG